MQPKNKGTRHIAEAFNLLQRVGFLFSFIADINSITAGYQSCNKRTDPLAPSPA